MNITKPIISTFLLVMVLRVIYAAPQKTTAPLKTKAPSKTTTTTETSVTDVDYKSTKTPIDNTKIVGGVAVDIIHYPYQLSLRRNEQHICGASLISTTYALTAAHCTFGSSATSLTVRAGCVFRGYGGYIYNVINIIEHESYLNELNDYDFSLLKLSPTVILTKKVNIIPLPTQAMEIPAGTLAVVSGWGSTRSGVSRLPSTLRAVSIPIVTNTACNVAYGDDLISGRMLCAGYAKGGKDSCQGDSGGPLVATIAGARRLIGVVSWGNGCAQRGFPGVYSNVSSMITWIKANAV